MSLFKLMKSIQDLTRAKPLTKSDEPVGDGPTPRKTAATETAKDLTGDEYKHARKSKFSNKGEDIAHSARHKVNKWRGLDTMLKHDPPNIMPKDGTNALKHLAAHYAISKFPKSPKVPKQFEGDENEQVWNEYERDGKVFGQHISRPAPVNATLKRTWTKGEARARARQIYVDSYKRAKKAAEDAVAAHPSPAHVVKSVQNEMLKNIHELRDTSSRYQPTMDSILGDMLIDYHNKTLRWGHRPKTSVYGALGEFEYAFMKKYGHMGGPGTPGEPNEFYNNILNHVTDVIDGKSLTKTFGLESKEVKRFDPVEAYVAHASRTGPEYGWKDSSAHDDYLMNQAKIRGLQYGNSVTDSEREHHLKHAAHAMRDLAEVLDLPHEMVSYNNRLGFAIGARGHGKALAHYEPLLRTINLTRKNGVGSLAHEWGHFFDNVLPETMGRGKHAYASEDMPHNRHLIYGLHEDDREEAGKLQNAMSGVMKVLNEDVDHRIRKEYRSGAPWAKGMTSEQLSNYWLTGRELFARAFERHIDKKLADTGRSNTYLAGVKPHPLWPTDEEVQKLQPLFDELFKHFKASKYLKKSMQLSKDLIPGGLADKRSPKEFDPKQLAMGIKVEMEHTNDGEKAKEIAMDHLVEDPEYYTKLQQIEKSATDKPKEVASIAIIDGDRLLMGKRNDNQRWTLPGGHLNTGETPCEGAARELTEETGIAVKPTDLVHLGTEEVTTFTGKRMIVHSFAYFGHHETNTERDPNEEVQTWRWVDCKHGLPKEIGNNLHSPKNVTLRLLGLQEWKND